MTWKADGLTNAGGDKDVPVRVVPVKGFLDLRESVFVNHVAPDEIAELEECTDGEEHLARYMPRDRRNVDLRETRGKGQE